MAPYELEPIQSCERTRRHESAYAVVGMKKQKREKAGGRERGGREAQDRGAVGRSSEGGASAGERSGGFEAG